MNRSISALKAALVVSLLLLVGCYGEVEVRPGFQVRYSGAWAMMGAVSYKDHTMIWYQEGTGDALREPEDPNVLAVNLTLYRQTGTGPMVLEIVDTEYAINYGMFTGSSERVTDTNVLEHSEQDAETIKLSHSW